MFEALFFFQEESLMNKKPPEKICPSSKAFIGNGKNQTDIY